MEQSKDPGLGSKFSVPIKRFLNEDGTYNIKRVGGIRGLKDFYKYLIFVLLFAILLYFADINQLSNTYEGFHPFWTAFFFSAQTLTTLGYGYISPIGFSANFIATTEAFIGLSITALATGLIYGRFSKPLLKLAFSHNAIISPFENTTALMFKMVNTRDNVLIKSKVSTILIIDKGEGDDPYNKDYHNLELELDTILFFPLSWTVVHKITSDSPLYNLTVSDLNRRHAELVVLFETFDETFGQEIIQKHSYAGDQWLENVKFDLIYGPNEKGQLEIQVKNINLFSPINN
jgi:inward rectifier potassium channel